MTTETVITLVGTPGQLDEADVKALAAPLRGVVECLSYGEAYDIITPLPLTIKDMAPLPGVDMFVQPRAVRRKRILLADMESTLIEQELLDELAARRGIGEEVARITQEAMEGKLDFAQGFKARMMLLRGTRREVLREALERVTYSPGAETLVHTLAANGIPTWIVSSGLTAFTQPIAEKLGCTHNEGNEALFNGFMLSGEVVEPIRDKHSKQVAVAIAAKKLDITQDDVAAVGDGANDLLMLKAAGAGFAYRAKPVVAENISHNIRNGTLTAILFAMGFRSFEFVK